jgi:hypothetical protein
MPAINMDPVKGALLSAEELAQIVMDILQLEADEKLGTFRVALRAMAPEQEFVFPGCIGYRVSLLLTAGKSQQTPRCGPVAISVNGVPLVGPTNTVPGTCALTCGTAGARIKYSLDGSYPSEDAANNPLSLLYSGAFALADGDVLRTAAYKPGLNKGPARYAEVHA